MNNEVVLTEEGFPARTIHVAVLNADVMCLFHEINLSYRKRTA